MSEFLLPTALRGRISLCIRLLYCGVFYWLSLLFPATAVGQFVEIPFEHLSLAEGLSNNDVYAIFQDTDGFMWIGTGEGLNKYNGHSFTIYTSTAADSTSLSDSWITAIAEDTFGILWFGTRNGGLNTLNKKTGEFERFKPSPPVAGLETSWITDIKPGPTGKLWVSTIGTGLLRIDPLTGGTLHYAHDPDDPKSLSNDRLWSLLIDRQETLWIGTWAAGIDRLRLNEQSFEHVRAEATGLLTSDRIRALHEDPQGDIWVGTSGGGLHQLRLSSSRDWPLDEPAPSSPPLRLMNHYGTGTSARATLNDNRVWSMAEDGNGNIWVGTFGGGLHKLDPETQQISLFSHNSGEEYGIGTNVISTLFVDRSGMLWIGSDQGVYKRNPRRAGYAIFRHEPENRNSLSHNDVLTVYQSRTEPHIIWLGTNGGGLNAFDTSTFTFTTYQNDFNDPYSLSHGVVSSITEDTSGQLWVGTIGGGLNRFNRTTQRFHQIEYDGVATSNLSFNAAHVLLADANGVLWIGTDGSGLSRYDPRDNTYTHFEHDRSNPNSLGDNNINALHLDRSGALWIGTYDGGLNRLKPGTDQFDRFMHHAADPTSLAHNRVDAIVEDAEGTLWVASYGGLNRMDPATEQFTRYNEQDGLPSKVILGLDVDAKGTLWINTSRGVSWLERGSQTYFTYNDSGFLRTLQPNASAFRVGSDGALLVGGANGFGKLPPPVRTPNPFTPVLLITAVNKKGVDYEREVHIGETITLDYEDTFFSFDMTLLDHTAPQQHRYQYMLEGFDNTWRHAEGPSIRATYTNDGHKVGTFRLVARALSINGTWSETWYLIKIPSPWWRSGWFLLLAVLGMVVLTTALRGVYRVWLGRVEQNEKRRILTEGRELERHLLAREIHDAPLQNLYRVRHKLEVFARMDTVDQKILEETRQVLALTANNLREICRELRPPALEGFGLSKAIQSHAITFESLHPELEITLDLANTALVNKTQIALFRIYQGALNNVLQHAEAQNVWVRYKIVNKAVLLEIQDDGCGFEVPKNWLELTRNQHYGLVNLDEWAQSIDGQLSVISKPGQGTLIRVQLPLADRLDEEENA